MDAHSDELQRRLAAATVIGASLVAAVVYGLSEVATIGQPPIVASAAALVVAVVGVGALGYDR